MKRVLLIVLAVLLIASFTSCAKTEEPEATEVPTEAPAVEVAPTEAPVVPSADTISAASADAYSYEEGTLYGEELFAAMSEMKGVSCIATVNEDNSPNIATMIPAHFTIDGVDYLVFGHGANQTVANLRRTGLGVLQFYIYDPSLQGDENKFVRNQGARIILKYVSESNEAIDEQTTAIYKASYTDSMAAWMTVVEVVEIKPLG